VSISWLNYHHLLYFWMVVKTGSITAAAKELRLAHPTISAQISTLEKNVGHKLFRQVGRRLELTEMGQLTYRYANDIFSLGDELRQTLEGRISGGNIALKVGIADVMPKPIAYRILAPALMSPEVHAVCYEGKPTMLMGQLAVHELDLVLSDFPLGPQFTLNAFSHLLGESGLTIFAAPELVRKYKKGFPQSLDGAPFLLPTPNTSLRRSMDHWFASVGIRPRVRAEFEDSELLKEYGQNSGGLFATSTMIEKHTLIHYRAKVVGRVESVRMQYYAISPERRITNPAVTLIVGQSRDVFASSPQERLSRSRTL
jgi:LysR family transcriptional activator of nhaA